MKFRLTLHVIRNLFICVSIVVGLVITLSSHLIIEGPLVLNSCHWQHDALDQSGIFMPSTNGRMASRSKWTEKSMKLPTPVIVVGFPKSGTSSIHEFFVCAGVKSQHYCCCDVQTDHFPCANRSMAHCILQNMGQKRPMLENCGHYQVYAQIDGERPVFAKKSQGPNKLGVLTENGTLEIHDTSTWEGKAWVHRHFLPQHFYLARLHEEHPTATFLLPTRDSVKWAHSVMNWYEMRMRLVSEYKHFNQSLRRPQSKKRSLKFLRGIYMDHIHMVRAFVQQHPSHTLVEVNIGDPKAGTILARAFGLDFDEHCWGHHNPSGNKTKERREDSRKERKYKQTRKKKRGGK